VLLLLTLLTKLIESATTQGTLLRWLDTATIREISSAFDSFVTFGNADDSFIHYICQVLSIQSRVFLQDLLNSEQDNTRSAEIMEHDDHIPVSELVLCAHLTLFLNIVVFGRFVSKRSRKIRIANKSTDRQWEICEAVQQATRVCSLLQRNSWWLCIRVLKASLALHASSGVLSVETFVACLSAITTMQNFDKKQLLTNQTLQTTLEPTKLSPDIDEAQASFMNEHSRRVHFQSCSQEPKKRLSTNTTRSFFSVKFDSWDDVSDDRFPSGPCRPQLKDGKRSCDSTKTVGRDVEASTLPIVINTWLESNEEEVLWASSSLVLQTANDRIRTCQGTSPS
jgi:hypothetical protein